MLYKLVLGDWSEDGHGESKDFCFECNHDVSEIRQAYKDSCKKLGITFNHNKNYTGRKLSYRSKRMIWTEYEENDMSKTAFDALYSAGCFNGIPYEEWNYYDETRYYIGDLRDCAMLIMNFIALSMPEDFTYNPVDTSIADTRIAPINGWWNPELNVQFGYGLFDV